MAVSASQRLGYAASIADESVATIVYTNYRGETSTRRIVPRQIRFGECEWHPGKQWLLDAFDLDKNAERSFSVKDIHRWLDSSK